MSYTPTEWECGDTITAAKMNKIEQGIADAGGAEPFFVNETVDDNYGNYVLDKTAQEITNAINAGKLIYIVDSEGSRALVDGYNIDEVTGGVILRTWASRNRDDSYQRYYSANSASAYPVDELSLS